MLEKPPGLSDHGHPAADPWKEKKRNDGVRADVMSHCSTGTDDSSVSARIFGAYQTPAPRICKDQKIGGDSALHCP